MHHPNIIKNPMSSHQNERKIMDGIVKGSFDDFQMKATKGLLSNAGMASHKPSGNKPSVMKAGGKPPATQLKDGFMPYQGASHSR